MVNFLSTIRAPTRANLSALSFPVYLSADVVSETRVMAVGIGSAKVMRATIASPTVVVASNVGSPVFRTLLRSDTLLFVRLIAEARAAVEMRAALSAETVLVATALWLNLPGAALRTPTALLAAMQPFLPEIREPEWYELRGTVNLLRNASLEQTDVGLLDWQPFCGATISLDPLLGWHGGHAVAITLPDTASDAGCQITSQRGLGITGGMATMMVGSLSLLGMATQLQLHLVAAYSDDSGTYVSGEPFDLATTDDDWLRAISPSLPLDAARVLDHLILVITRPIADETTTIWADGAQIEQDRGEGATPFAQGDMGEHYAWLGPEGLSMSLRETMAVTT